MHGIVRRISACRIGVPEGCVRHRMHVFIHQVLITTHTNKTQSKAMFVLIVCLITGQQLASCLIFMALYESELLSTSHKLDQQSAGSVFCQQCWLIGSRQLPLHMTMQDGTHFQLNLNVVSFDLLKIQTINTQVRKCSAKHCTNMNNWQRQVLPIPCVSVICK